MKVGDFVTYCKHGGFLVLSEVLTLSGDRGFLTPEAFLMIKDEGQAWIRGHFNRDTEEGKALIAAHIITAERPTDIYGAFQQSVSYSCSIPGNVAGFQVLTSWRTTI